MRRRWLILVPAVSALAMLVPWLVAGAGRAPAVEAETTSTPAPITPNRSSMADRVGTASCSARGCHGKVAPQGTEGSEYNTWLHLDPHTGAFLALFEPRSRTIQEHLGAKVPAFEDALCQSCHGQPDPGVSIRSDPGIPADDPVGSLVALRIGPSGVGCEDCHGAASNWLDAHYTDGWSDQPDAVKRQAGMTILRPTARRAQVCARCHVGENLSRQVNHDLIAAGHPRLNFELSAFTDRMPRHWASEPTTPPGPEGDGSKASEWAIGQIGTLRATLELLAARASDRAGEAPSQPWPEFTEYGCFACHHDNQDAGLRYTRDAEVPGSLPWNTWAMPMARVLIDRHRPDLLDPLNRIDRLMTQPAPPADAIAPAALALADDLGAWLDAMESNPIGRDDHQAMLRSIASDSRLFDRLTSNWDAAAQLSLAIHVHLIDALDALAENRAGAPPDRVEHLRAQILALESLNDALRFPPEHPESPGIEAEPDPDQPGAIIRSLRSILDRIGSGPSS